MNSCLVTNFRKISTSSLALLIVSFCGCRQLAAGYELGSTTPYYENRLISSQEQDGDRRMDIEAAADSKMAAYFAEHGRPDFMLVKGTYSGKMYYLKRNKTVIYTRSMLTGLSEFKEIAEIPAFVKRRATSYEGVNIKTPSPRKTKVAQGTAFFIKPDTLVTAYHVVENTTEIVIFVKDAWIPVTLQRKDSINDIAILHCERPFPEKVIPIYDGAPTIGEKVFSVGFPVAGLLGKEPKFADGVISTIADGQIQITVPVQPGCSGAPLINEKGEVIGVITSKISEKDFMNATGTLPQNINFAANAKSLPPYTYKSTLKQESLVKRAIDSICIVRAKE